MLTVLAYNGLQHLSCWQVTGVSVAGSSGHVQLACSLHLQTSCTCSGWQKSHCWGPGIYGFCQPSSSGAEGKRNIYKVSWLVFSPVHNMISQVLIKEAWGSFMLPSHTKMEMCILKQPSAPQTLDWMDLMYLKTKINDNQRQCCRRFGLQGKQPFTYCCIAGALFTMSTVLLLYLHHSTGTLL